VLLLLLLQARPHQDTTAIACRPKCLITVANSSSCMHPACQPLPFTTPQHQKQMPPMQ
jgi:hypothetical protein